MSVNSCPECGKWHERRTGRTPMCLQCEHDADMRVEAWVVAQAMDIRSPLADIRVAQKEIFDTQSAFVDQQIITSAAVKQQYAAMVEFCRRTRPEHFIRLTGLDT